MAYETTPTQVDIAERVWIARVGNESAFNQGSGAYEDALFADGPEPECNQQEVQNLQQSGYLFKNHDPIKGLKDWKLTRTFYPAPPTAQYLAAATPADDFQSVLLKAAFGGERRAAGSLVIDTPSPTATVFAVTSTQGSRFLAGQVILVEVNGALEPTMVQSVATDTITLRWPLSDAPATGALVVNASTYYLTQTISTSLAVRLVHALSAQYQWQLNGAIVNALTWKWERDGLLECQAELMGASWEGPDALGLSTTAAANECIEPEHTRNALLYLMDVDDMNREPIPFTAFELKTTLGNQLVKQIGGNNEGYTSVAKAGDRMTTELTITTRSDTWPHYLHDTRKKLFLCLHLPNPLAGTDQRGCSLFIPYCKVVGVPQPGEEEAMRRVKFVIQGDQNQMPGAATDLAWSPVLFVRW